ncbi:MAG: LPS-assembly protein LptD [Campylobacterota bacterium]|nr:LPS-assembly protein LptD [Campylobacterota bacterium]
MYRFLYLIVVTILLTTKLYGKTFNDDEYLQIVAHNLEIKDNIITANGDVLVYSPDYYITADRLIYDKADETLELFGDVNIIKENNEIVFSQYLFMNKKDDINKFKPMLLLEKKEKIWFNSSLADSKKDLYNLEDSTLSSCDCKDPDWSIGFTSGDHNTTNQWINTYNTTLYIKDIPILYTPYFGFPTGKTRKSGLLKPTIGWSSKDGFHYAQPIFIAPKNNWDIEYIPSMKTQRGHGNELKFRYADSLYSMLSMDTAYFKEKSDYKEEQLLENDKHYGWNLEYKRTKLFSNQNHSDGLLVKLLNMNDVDYINTKYNSDNMNYTNKFLESKVSYFYNTNNYFSGIDFKYYNDITLDNNDDILQTIPSINLHKYSNNLFLDNFSYSTDIKFLRKTRENGLDAKSTDITLPISYHTFLFNDYINLLFSEQIYFTNIKYSDSQSYEDVNYARNNHILSLYTDLIKPYDNFLHALKFNTTFTYANSFVENGDIYGISNNDAVLSDFAITQSTKNISLGFNQSFYNKETIKEIINHRIKQSFVYNSENNSYEKSYLENDLKYFYDYGSLSNRIIYSHNLNKIINSSTTLKFTKDDYFFNIYHIYSKNTDSLLTQKNINYELGMGFYKYYKASYREEYDLTSNISKKKEYIFNIDKKCWAINFKLADSLVATDTTNDSTLRQNIFYIEVNLKQLFQLDQQYKFKERLE